MHRLYENNDIAVFWNSEKCFHSKKCVCNSPATFDPTRKPWIDVNRAETKEIWQAIQQCPSGALSCVYRHDIDVVMDDENCRSVAYDGDKEIGECDYEITENGWNIYHTGVSPEYGGKGIAKRLVFKVFEAADKSKAKVQATCSYAAKMLD